MTRPLYAIATEIENSWKNVNYAARPYLDAMHDVTGIHDDYWHVSSDDIILYFLANASMWRGDVARRIKAELNAML
tara:strand:+ start:904 stop:1131 length:228 start_codon:yes stop_codon:yes gene_type:complete